MRVRAVGVGESGVPWMAASSCSARRRESIELREGTPSASSGVRSPDAGLDVGDIVALSYSGVGKLSKANIDSSLSIV